MKLLAVLLAGVLAAVLLVGGNVVASARAYDTSPSDAIVVLGAAQYWGDPSPVLANRLNHAADLYQQGVAPTIVTVGGGMPGDKTTEAQAGVEYLAAKGIPREDLVAIGTGSDTIESLEAVSQQASDQGWDRLMVVSDRAHVARSSAIAEGLGFETVVSGPASGDGSTLSFERVGRETLGLLRFYVWDRWQLERG
ncbi:YdcF family protein [Candidatus Nanopelagicales bacterium]|nr:YdcF family protein [Candidatus Nanopelagicales bacterium]